MSISNGNVTMTTVSPLFREVLSTVHSDPCVVLCYSQFVRVDEQGKRLGVKSSRGSR